MKIAIVGATGLVGETILKILDEKGYTKNNEILLYTSSKSSGLLITINQKTYITRELTIENIDKTISFAIFSAGSSVSTKWAKEFVKNGAFVIDNSSAFRRYKNIPLVIPEINASLVTPSTKIIANPNCSTILLALPIYYLLKSFKIKRIVVSTYQAVSGAGRTALKDLSNNTNNKLSYKIQNNLIPQIDKFLKNGSTFEEDKISFEVKKILNDNNIKISATAVRVPIQNCHSESVNIEFENKVTINQIKNILSKIEGVKYLENNQLPMPLTSKNQDEIFIGRVRKDSSQKNSFNMFLCFDNLRKGAALNAIQIMDFIIENYYKKS